MSDDSIEDFDDERGGRPSSQWFLLGLTILILLGGGLWYALSAIQPPPQKEIVLSTGGEAGAYHAFGKRYQQILEKEGVRVRLVTSAGAIENLARLKDEKSGVTAALMQGGIGDGKDISGLLSAGRIFYEPVWVFYRSTETWQRLSQLRGAKIAVGAEGSGTRALTTEMLKLSRISPDNATFLPLGGQAAVDALFNGQVDAAMLTFAPEAPILQKLVRDPSVKLMSLEQADAMTRMLPYLAKVTLPRGVFDLETNLPPADINLVAPVASLVVRSDLHPSLVMVLAQALSETHSTATLLQRVGEFPIASDPTFPMSDDATRYYKAGQPFLRRYLPFWLANFAERMLVILLPLATIAVPLVKGAPALYRWRVRQRLHYWYGRLKRLEGKIVRGENREVSRAHRMELDVIDGAVRHLNVPKAFAEHYYNLRSHVDLVRNKLPG